jgi:hypothetical protein
MDNCYTAALTLGFSPIHTNNTISSPNAAAGCHVEPVAAGRAAGSGYSYTLTLNMDNSTSTPCGNWPSGGATTSSITTIGHTNSVRDGTTLTDLWVEIHEVATVSNNTALDGSAAASGDRVGRNASTVTITMTTPESGVAFGAQGMDEKPYAIIVDGFGNVTERQLANHAPGTLLQPTIVVISNEVPPALLYLMLALHLLPLLYPNTGQQRYPYGGAPPAFGRANTSPLCVLCQGCLSEDSNCPW